MNAHTSAYEGKLPPAGVQQTVNQRRSKLFFGRRYYDYQSGRTTRLASDGMRTCFARWIARVSADGQPSARPSARLHSRTDPAVASGLDHCAGDRRGLGAHRVCRHGRHELLPRRRYGLAEARPSAGRPLFLTCPGLTRAHRRLAGRAHRLQGALCASDPLRAPLCALRALVWVPRHGHDAPAAGDPPCQVRRHAPQNLARCWSSFFLLPAH